MKYNSLPLIWIISRSFATRPTRYENKRTDYPGINRVLEDQRMDVVGGILKFHREKFFYVFFIFARRARRSWIGKPRNKKFRVH